MHAVEFYSIDSAGNTETVRTGSVRIDKSGPTSGSDADAFWHADHATLSLTATDALSGVDAIKYRVAAGAVTTYAGPFAVSADGMTAVSFWGVDAVGNVGVTNTSTVQVDRNPPVTGSNADSAWHKPPCALVLTPVDTESGVASTLYSLDGTAAQPYLPGITVSKEGTTTLSYRSTDAVGNAEGTATVLLKIDATPPVTSCDATAAYLNTAVVHLTPVDHLSGPEATYYSTDGSFPSRAYSGACTITADGTTTLRYYSVDTAGNAEAAQSAIVRVDHTPPVTTSSADSSWHGGTVSVSLSATDPLSGVAGIWYKVGAGSITTYTVPFNVSTEGTNTVLFGSADRTGNQESTETAYVKIDKTRPSTTYETTTTPATVTLKPTDTMSGAAGTWWRKNGAGAWTAGVAVGTVIASDTLEFYSTDAAGNTEMTRTASFPASSTQPVRYEQSDGKLGYTGAWSEYVNANMSGGSYWFLNSAGRITVSFTGTGIDWITPKSSSYGIANVTLDGNSAVQVDLYASSNQYKQKVYSVSRTQRRAAHAPDRLDRHEERGVEQHLRRRRCVRRHGLPHGVDERTVADDALRADREPHPLRRHLDHVQHRCPVERQLRVDGH